LYLIYGQSSTCVLHAKKFFLNVQQHILYVIDVTASPRVVFAYPDIRIYPLILWQPKIRIY